jgi:probable HAF family extracellular repeat protein
MKFIALTCVSVMSLAALAAPIRLAAQSHKLTQYTVTNLGTLGGKQGSSAHGINNRSWVTGDANLPGDTAEHAYVWRDGVMIDLGTLGGVNSNVDLPVKNNRGLIVGFAQTSTVDPLGENFCTFTCTNSGGSPPVLTIVGRSLES